MDGDEEIRSDDGSATPVQDEQEDARPGSRQSDEDVSDNEDAAHDRKSENADSSSDHEARGRGAGDGSDSEPEPPRPADSDEEEEGRSPVKRRASTSENEEEEEGRSPVKRRASTSENDEEEEGRSPVKRRASTSENDEEEEGRSPVKRRASTSENDEEEEEKTHSDREEPEKRNSPKSEAGSDSDEDKPKQKTQRDSDAEEEEEGGRKETGKWKAVMNSDSEEEEERPKEEAGSDEDEGPKRRALASDDDDNEEEEKPVKRKKAVLSDSEEDEEKEVKKSRLVSDDEDSGSDEGFGGPDKSLAAKLKELGSDSEDEEDAMKADAGKKDEKALFGSDSESGEDQEEKMIADIFGESGDEEEEEFTGFNQDELEGERAQAQVSGQKEMDNESDSDDDDVDRSGKDMSHMSDFDIMLARKKAQSGKRRRNRDGGTFISDADDVVSAMITKMTEAAEEDRTLNSSKKPALKKLMLLPTVVMHLKKQDLKETFIDSGVMAAIKEWISPLPDRSLPALKIREELLKILQELPSVSQETLKLSGIGRAVMYLYKHPKESRPNKDLALKLINEWSRPIFGLTSNYKGMTREERQQRDLDQQIAPRRRLSSGGQTPRRDLEKVLTGEEKALRPGDPGFCARARVPMPSNKDYVVRPKWNVDGDSNRSGPMKKGMTRVDKQLRRFADIKRLTKPGHAVKISVEGNRMPL
ncbi:protein IWS1 homolog isoform X1 [Pimephales promelas]|uniref:protein IWS1 homolog isoform X1 n=1 Tax=Pimephales promelas TaxID=90988 RepID=UPI0019558244|nr:protein IWS1 homolog isoform X1 [Pimephales promelas]KAG1932727.1 protein IWS1 [Pimephales promelas]